MAWSAPIWIYLWLAGMAGGGYFTAFLTDRFTGGKNKSLLRLSTYLGIPLAIIGVLLLIVDLGKPIRFWHLFTEFKVISPMSMGTWILLLWVIIAVIMVILWWISNRFLSEETARSARRFTGFLGWINLVLAAGLITYTGVLLAVSNQSLWAGTVILPCLFVASAISTGIALLILGSMASNVIGKGGLAELKVALNQLFGTTEWTIPNRTIARLAEADAIVIFIEIAALVGYVIWLAVSQTAGAGAALGILARSGWFWGGVVVLALLIPVALDFANWGRNIETRKVWRAVMASSTCVILGGLVLRAVITISGQL